MVLGFQISFPVVLSRNVTRIPVLLQGLCINAFPELLIHTPFLPMDREKQRKPSQNGLQAILFLANKTDFHAAEINPHIKVM